MPMHEYANPLNEHEDRIFTTNQEVFMNCAYVDALCNANHVELMQTDLLLLYRGCCAAKTAIHASLGALLRAL